MNFVTLSTDPSSYGSAFDPADVSVLNATIREAAEKAGVDVIEGYSTTRQSEERRDNGDEELDWFATWCAGGHEWNQEQWNEWFLANTLAREQS